MEPFDFSLPLPHDPSLLRELRYDLASWLEVVGIPDEARDPIVLATHEAAARAIEHGRSGSAVRVRGTRDEDKLLVVVTSDGAREQDSEDTDSATGLTLMAALMSGIDVRVESQRTTVRMRMDLSGSRLVPG